MPWFYVAIHMTQEIKKGSRRTINYKSLVYINIYIFTLFVCLCSLNVKTAEPIGSTTFVATHMTPGKVYGIMVKIDKFCLKKSLVHCDLKVLHSQAKFDENFANYFLKTKANNKCFIVLKIPCKGHKWVRAVKSKALRHFKVDPVLKIDETVYKQAESMWV